MQGVEGLEVQDSLLQSALQKGCVAMVRLLLSHGADIHASHFKVRYNPDLP